MPRKHGLTLKLPAHVILFQYADVPGEINVTCLEAGAFGSGATVKEAFDNLLGSIRAQFEASAPYGPFTFFRCGADPEWVQAWKVGKHPALDSVRIDLKGVLTLRATLGGGKPRLELEPEMACESSLGPSLHQPV